MSQVFFKQRSFDRLQQNLSFLTLSQQFYQCLLRLFCLIFIGSENIENPFFALTLYSQPFHSQVYVFYSRAIFYAFIFIMIYIVFPFEADQYSA